MFPSILKFLRLDVFENLEELYAPVILGSFTIAISIIFVLILVPNTSWSFLLIAIYINVYLRTKDFARRSGAALKREWQMLNRYRKATLQEIQRFDDVCAVCLCSMTKARVTPCSHLFHADCLRRCLKTVDTCPMCKRQLKMWCILNKEKKNNERSIICRLRIVGYADRCKKLLIVDIFIRVVVQIEHW